ncbi:MAG: hypothetical protein ACJ761_10850 [Chloroflexota bacterium]
MIRTDLDRLIATWLDEDAGAGAPDYLDETLAGIGHLRQRPAWASPGRWLPVQMTLPRVVIPRAIPAILVTGLLILALVAAAVFVGSRRHVPAPFGLAATGLLAYDSNGDILVAQADGSGTRPVITGPAQEFGATWSRDGSRLAYWSGSTAAASLWTADADGSNPRQLTAQTFGVEPLGPAADWSPGGDKLAFATTDGRLYVIGADGTDLRRLGDDRLQRGLPGWSPDGTLIAFRAAVQGEPENWGGYVVRPDGTDEQQISPPKGDTETTHILMNWTHDSRALIYHTGTAGQLSIAESRRGADGRWHERVLVPADPRNLDILPMLSNDGGRLAFIRAVSGAGTSAEVNRVMIANVDGSDIHELSTQRVALLPLCWTPDDRSIRAVADTPGSADRTIVVIPLDGAPVVTIPAASSVSAACPLQRLAP